MTRPTSIGEMLERIRDFRTEESLAAGLGIAVRPDDVFIATYSKSGTTWVQQVVHGLRSGGSMDFDEISGVVPWLESAVDMGIDPAADQAWRPRAFKSHLTWREVPKGGRYITVFRDPASVLPSFYRFFEGWWFEPGTVTPDEFALEFYLKGSASGRHWDHFVDWWPQLDRPNVLGLAYEDMVEVPDAVAPVVAEFMGMADEHEVVEKVIRQTSRHFMAEHSSKFDEHLMRNARDHIWGLPPGEATAKVYAEASKVRFSPEVVQAISDAWTETVTPALGFESYAEMRKAMPNPLGVLR